MRMPCHQDLDVKAAFLKRQLQAVHELTGMWLGAAKPAASSDIAATVDPQYLQQDTLADSSAPPPPVPPAPPLPPTSAVNGHGTPGGGVREPWRSTVQAPVEAGPPPQAPPVSPSRGVEPPTGNRARIKRGTSTRSARSRRSSVALTCVAVAPAVRLQVAAFADLLWPRLRYCRLFDQDEDGGVVVEKQVFFNAPIELVSSAHGCVVLATCTQL